jgi:hypothetical protein
VKKIGLLTLFLAALALPLVGCGGSDEAEGATPTQAVAEIETIRGMLDEAAREYEAGNTDEAEDTVGNAYLEHFEKVEDPLGERDHEQMEELEERISTEIRDRMKAGAPASEIESLIAETKRELARATETLQK